jgi:hypothetical protein
MRGAAAALICVALISGCGDGDGSDEVAGTTAATPTVSTATEPPSGPAVRICDRRLAAAATMALREQGFRGPLGGKPAPSGTPRLSVCELAGRGAEVSVSVDAATDAVRRYQFRVTETAQFSGGDPENAPHTVKGVGDPRLGGAGANWLPRTKLLLSVRGRRVLIVDVSADGLKDDSLRDAAIQISLNAWGRLL